MIGTSVDKQIIWGDFGIFTISNELANFTLYLGLDMHISQQLPGYMRA